VQEAALPCCLLFPFACPLHYIAFVSIMQVSPQDSGSSAGSQSAGAGTGEASAPAAAGRPSRDMPFSGTRSSPSRKLPGGWMGRAGAAVGDSIGGNVAPKVAHQDVFLGEWLCAEKTAISCSAAHANTSVPILTYEQTFPTTLVLLRVARVTRELDGRN